MIAATDNELENVWGGGGGEEHHVERSRWFPFDRCLLNTLVDWWRLETHTFYLSFGEMTVTLHDVAMLTGLPIGGVLSPPPYLLSSGRMRSWRASRTSYCRSRREGT